jgi:hypothetical protein
MSSSHGCHDNASVVFYNTGIVSREHKYMCSHRNESATCQYTTLFSVRPGDMNIELEGRKNGFDDCMYPNRIVKLQASVLYIHVTVNKSLLSEDMYDIPCYREEYNDDRKKRITFTFHDGNAFAAFMSHVGENYYSVVPLVVELHRDWEYLDIFAAGKSATVIQRAVKDHVYDPNKPFHVTQSHHNW